MGLHPEIQLLLQQLEEVPPVNQLTPKQARWLAEGGYRLAKQNNNFAAKVTVKDTYISDYVYPLPLRIYTPETKSTEILPIIVYFHGGGWVLGNLDAADGICRFLADQAQSIVVSVDYRLAPEHKFPIALEDAYAATLWVSHHAPNLGGNPQQIIVAGDSAGANLATVVALMARDQGKPDLKSQILIYPVTNCQFNSDSYQKYATGYGLRKEEMIWFWEHYLDNLTQGNHPYASPLQAENLSNLPPAYIITAEFDILRSEAEAYMQRLKEAGVAVVGKCYQGMIHGFIGIPQLLTLGYPALSDIAQWTIDN